MKRSPRRADLKVVILAGGMGTRLSEETELRPKPMVEIGGRPILWHIMKHYSHYGFRDFVIALGYKGAVIKQYFLDVMSVDGSMIVDLKRRSIQRQGTSLEDWKVHLVDTGLETMTGGRLRRLSPLLRDGTFMVTYGDGLSDIDIRSLLRFHRSHGRLATVAAVQIPARFGAIELAGDQVRRFREKASIRAAWINGGFFVLEPGALDYIRGDETPWEADPLERLARDGHLMAYRHQGFWQCMDTARDRRLLEELWVGGRAPWRAW